MSGKKEVILSWKSLLNDSHTSVRTLTLVTVNLAYHSSTLILLQKSSLNGYTSL